ncbi:RDD family protein [Nocardia sp. NPDC049190]|uniref:RDD family protein n=1 Tax=Nocardia sp. NPDC049190 TaxID=3155650 RepID=UPI0033F3B221
MPAGSFDSTRDGRGHVLMRPAAAAADADRHGREGDPRYPSPRRLRRALAFAIDWALHFGIAAAILVLGKGNMPAFGGIAVGAWLASSFADRVLVQGAWHTTAGKALFGLCVMRPDDGTFPSYGRLTRVWFMDLYFALILPLALLGGDGPSPDRLSDYFLPRSTKA